ncbi:hypothetical protein HaLaN_24828, partial [Haematococcus lacustris]
HLGTCGTSRLPNGPCNVQAKERVGGDQARAYDSGEDGFCNNAPQEGSSSNTCGLYGSIRSFVHLEREAPTDTVDSVIMFNAGSLPDCSWSRGKHMLRCWGA